MDLKFLRLKKKFKKSEHQPNPDFYWRIILAIFSILILSSFVFGAYLFFAVNEGDFSSTIIYTEQSQKISKERMGKVLDFFTNRSDKSKQILNSPALESDPSI